MHFKDEIANFFSFKNRHSQIKDIRMPGSKIINKISTCYIIINNLNNNNNNIDNISKNSFFNNFLKFYNIINYKI